MKKLLLVGDWASGCKMGQIRFVSLPMLVNLEGPLLPSNHNLIPIAKAGPHIYSTNVLTQNFDIIWGLANNHLMDYGLAGLETTWHTLAKHKQLSVGAGHNDKDAHVPIIVNIGGVDVGIISCCEAQFGIARINQPGVAEFGDWLYLTINQLKNKTNIVIVSIHAGSEDAPWPSPKLQSFYRSLIDAGASIIHGHHSHIPQGVEVYKGGLITYGLGNFLVDPARWQEIPNTLWSIGVEIDLTNLPLNWRIRTFEVRSGTEQTIFVEESNSDEYADHLQYIRHCNAPLSDPILLAGLWQEIALRNYFHHHANYLNFPENRQNNFNLKKIIYQLGSKIKGYLLGQDIAQKKLKANRLLWYHLFACESHRQMLTTALGVLAGEIEDLRTEETQRLADEMNI